MPRVHQVAKELGLTSREVIAELNALGYPVTTHASSIDEKIVGELRTRLENKPVIAPPEGEAPEEKAHAPARAKVPQAEGEAAPETRTATMPHASAIPDDVPAAWRPRVQPRGDGPVPAPQPAPAAPPAPTTTLEKKRERPWFLRQLVELPVLVALAFLIAIFIKTFVAQAFFIPSPSMRPTLKIGDRVLVEKLSYRFSDPGRGDVVVFAKEVFGAPQDLPWQQDARNFLRELLGLPTGNEEDYIKRIVAVGGDVVRYRGTPRRLTVNGDGIEEPYITRGRDSGSQSLKGRDCERLEMEPKGGGCVVPDGTVFVMGDNRGNSEDSRVIGPISEDKIVGRAFLVIWPPGDWSGL